MEVEEDEVGRYALEWGKQLMKRMGQKNQIGPGKITEAVNSGIRFCNLLN